MARKRHGYSARGPIPGCRPALPTGGSMTVCAQCVAPCWRCMATMTNTGRSRTRSACRHWLAHRRSYCRLAATSRTAKCPTPSSRTSRAGRSSSASAPRGLGHVHAAHGHIRTYGQQTRRGLAGRQVDAAHRTVEIRSLIALEADFLAVLEHQADGARQHIGELLAWMPDVLRKLIQAAREHWRHDGRHVLARNFAEEELMPVGGRLVV